MESRVEQVTVYARGARVRRVTTLGSPRPCIRIDGLPLSVIDDTVRVSVDGPAVATAIRTSVDAPSTDAAAPEESVAVREAKRLVALADVEIARLEGALERLTSASIVVEDPSDEPPAAWSAIVAARRSIITLRATRELALRDALTAERRAGEREREKLAAAADRDRRDPDRDPKLHEVRKAIEIDLTSTGDGPLEVTVEYLIDAARWAPTYVARIDGDRASIEIRAVVAQASGEDWTTVALQLSTAEPTRFAQLPELAAQRIGRKQAEPARSGFRAPPTGAAALFADYDRHAPPPKPKREPVRSRKLDELDKAPAMPVGATTIMADAPELAPAAPLSEVPPADIWDDGSSASKQRFSTPPQGIPMPQQATVRGRAVYNELSRSVDEDLLSSSFDRPAAATPAPIAQPISRLDYGNLVMAPPTSPRRGSLIDAPASPWSTAIAHAIRAGLDRIDELSLPAGCEADWSHAYDYAYSTDGTVDVRSDGTWHSIAVTSSAGRVELRHVAVPREQADVFRIATFGNPFAGPLLPGPIDVYDRGRFLVTSPLEHAPPGAPVEIGLGVDAAIKIARNTEFSEEATGMLRGALRLHHAIAIDVENASGRPIDLEVRERIPVTREGDDDIEVTLGKVSPAWERWTPDADRPGAARLRGAYRWRVAIPAGGKKRLDCAYEVKIPGKAELVGGNRRER